MGGFLFDVAWAERRTSVGGWGRLRQLDALGRQEV